MGEGSGSRGALRGIRGIRLAMGRSMPATVERPSRTERKEIGKGLLNKRCSPTLASTGTISKGSERWECPARST